MTAGDTLDTAPLWQDEPFTTEEPNRKKSKKEVSSKKKSGKDPLMMFPTHKKSQEIIVEDPVARRGTKNFRDNARIWFLLSMLFLSLFLVTIIVLPLVFVVGVKNDKASVKSSPAAASTASPVNKAPAATEFELDLILPVYTKEAIEADASSPQASAYRWVQNDPLLDSYSQDRLLQRFALATFFYATSGNSWNTTSSPLFDDEHNTASTTNAFLSYDTHECDWVQTLTKPKATIKSAAVDDDEATIKSAAVDDNEAVIKPLCGDSDRGHSATANNAALTTRRGYRGYHGYYRPQKRRHRPTRRRRWRRSSKGKSKGGKSYSYADSYDSYYYSNGYYSSDSYDSRYYYHSKGKSYYRRDRNRELQEETEAVAAPDTNTQEDEDDWEPVRFLHFPSNNLMGVLPPELALLTDVQSIDLSNNYLYGTLPKKILGAMGQLTSLTLKYNILSGSLPTEIGLLGSKSQAAGSSGKTGSLTLNLAHNYFNSTIPQELAILTGLETLDLADNAFFGPISHLTSLSNLKGLLLYQNGLSGNLPETIDMLTSLSLFEADNNKFTGNLVTELGALKNLKRLLLDNNNFYGFIPSEIGGMEALEVLGLTSSRLTGTLPTELGMCSSLQHLWLYDNAFYGFIPSELGTLVTEGSLELVMLHENEFIGIVPEGLCSLKQLQFDCPENTEHQLLCGCGCACHAGASTNGTTAIASNSSGILD